jgi:hypothetical protein
VRFFYGINVNVNPPTFIFFKDDYIEFIKVKLLVMKQLKLIPLLLILSFFGCIKDDYIDDSQETELRITSTIDTLAMGDSYQMEALYLDNTGTSQNVGINWSSADPTIISITDEGLATGNNPGNTNLYATYESLIDTINVAVGATTMTMPEMREGTASTTSSYALTGYFTLIEDGDNLILEFFNDYNASTALPGLVVYLSNNANSSGSALEIAAVTTYNGAHSYSIPNTGINDYKYVLYFCKPFNVKVGHGEILLAQ